MPKVRDAIMIATRGQMVATDGQICDGLIALIDSSSAARVDANRERIRLLTTSDGQLSRTARETLTLTQWGADVDGLIASSAETRELITACLHFAQSAAVIADSLAKAPTYLESVQTRADAALIAARADVSILRCLRALGVDDGPDYAAQLAEAEARERAAHDHNNNVISARSQAVRNTARALWPNTAAQSDAEAALEAQITPKVIDVTAQRNAGLI